MIDIVICFLLTVVYALLFRVYPFFDIISPDFRLSLVGDGVHG